MKTLLAIIASVMLFISMLMIGQISYLTGHTQGRNVTVRQFMKALKHRQYAFPIDGGWYVTKIQSRWQKEEP